MLKYKTLAKAVIKPGIYVLDSIIFDGWFSLPPLANCENYKIWEDRN